MKRDRLGLGLLGSALSARGLSVSIGLASIGAVVAPNFAMAQFVTNGGAAPSATGTDASAGGSGATATGTSSVAVGEGASSVGLGDIAIGLNALSKSSTTDQGAVGAIAVGADSTVQNTVGGRTAGVAIGQFATGNSTSTTASSPVAIGYDANATGAGSQVAIGDRAVASGTDAIGIGGHADTNGVTASGNQSVAIGQTAIASGQSALAIGNDVSAYNTGSLAFGPNAVAGVSGSSTVLNDIAIGSDASATGGASQAIGSGASATTLGGVALGSGSTADRAGLGGGTETFSGTTVPSTQGAVSVGAPGAERQIINVAGGTQPTDAVNVRQLSAVGSNLAGSLGSGAAFNPTTGAYTSPTYTIGGTNYNNVGSALTALSAASGVFVSDNTAGAAAPVATGANSSAGGYGASATGAGSTVVGNGATDNGQGGAVAVGNNASAGSAKSIAIGQGATTMGGGGVAAVAIGNAAVAQGDGALSLGLVTNANGTGATASGNHSSATGDSAVAFGDLATAAGTSATSFGVGSKANGESAFAAGTGATATGASAFAMGTGASASQEGAIAFGSGAASSAGDAVSIGTGANSTVAGGLALGAGSTASRAGLAGSAEAFSGATVASTLGAVSVGAAGAERQITNVAGGTQATDAVNVRQLSAVGSDLAGSLGGGAAFDPTTGAYTAPAFTTAAGTTANTVQAALGNETAAITSLGNGTASKLGGGVTYSPTTGLLTNGFTVNGTTYGDVASAISGAAADDGVVQRTGTAGQVAVTAPGGTGTAPGAVQVVTNVAAGQVAAASTQAVNGGQLYGTAASVASGLGGGSIVNTDGTLSAPAYMVGGQTYNNVGAALTAGNALGVEYTPNASGAPTNAIDLTKGGTLAPVVVTGLANATAATGAVALAQMPLQYATAGAPTTANPAVPSNDVTLVGSNTAAPVSLRNLAAGTLSATSTDAVNGSQLYGVSNNVDALGTTTATAIGGNATYTPGVGINGLSYTLRGSMTPFTTVVAGEQALANGAVGPVQYAVPGTPSNALNLVGTSGPVTLGNVGAGNLSATSTDAVNGSQLYATDQAVASIVAGSSGLVQQNPTTRAISIGAMTDGTTVGFANMNNQARTLTGVAAGQVATGSTQAVNGGQLAGTAGSVATALGGGSVVNPDGTISAPTYDVANGSFNNVGSALTALNNGINNGQLGAFHSDNTAGAASPAATGANSVAGGFGASATGASSTVVGNGATDNGNANATVVGNGAAVAAGLAGSNVALGQGTVAGRGAETGYTGYGVGTTTSTGEVAVGTPTATRTITGVAAGRLPTDAANVAQLRAVGSDLAGSLGGGAAFDPTTGAYTAPAYTVGGQTYDNIGAALAAGNVLAVQYTPNATGGATNAIDLTKGGTLNPVAMTGLAAGALTAASTDAVNGSQLFATNQQVAALEGGTAGLVQQNPTTRAITVGAGTDGTTVGFANNAGVARTLTGVAAGQVTAGGTQAVNGGQLYGTAGSVAAALGGGSAVNADGTVSAPTYGVDGKSYGSVGGAITALDSTGVKYDVVPATGARGQSITLAGGDPNQPVLIHNVAAGAVRTDAANFGQVQDAQTAANQYTNQQVSGVSNQLSGVNNRLSNLESDISETRNEARSAAAVGLAAGSLRYDDRPGKLSVASGGGYWRGEAAAAFGLGYTLPDGRFRLNAAAATAGNNVGVGAGASYTFN